MYVTLFTRFEGLMPLAVPGAPPEFPQCDPLSPSSVTVSWKPPPVEQSHGLILGYTLTYRLENKIGGELTHLGYHLGSGAAE